MCETRNKLPREFIQSLSKPVIFHDMIREWEVLKWNIEHWSTMFGDKQLPFRCGVQCCSLQPLWERYCSKETMTLDEFVDIQQNQSELRDAGKWFYFDYKYLNEWLSEDNGALKSVSWSNFGFPEIDAAGSTLWIGSGGAHTSCHYDTYGCNLVAQVSGTKRWFLWPPSESKNMKPTRIPYEESSVYSTWNFNCPLPPEFFNGCKEMYIVEMKPGDVLFVPRHWWHYVECLDTSISMNTWIPTNLDDISRLDEALVKFTVSQISKHLSDLDKSVMLNPNEDDVNGIPVEDCTDTINYCVDKLKLKTARESENSPLLMRLPSLVMDQVEDVPCSTHQELRNLTNDKCNCISEERHLTLMKEADTVAKNPGILLRRSETVFHKVVNAFCNPEVIKKVRETLTDSFKIG